MSRLQKHIITILPELLPTWLRRPTHLLSLKLVIRESGRFPRQRIQYAIDFLESIREARVLIGEARVVFELNHNAALRCNSFSSGTSFIETCKSLEDTLLNFPRGQTVFYDPDERLYAARTTEFWYPSVFPRLANRGLLSYTESSRSMCIVLRMKAGSFLDDRVLGFRDDWSSRWTHHESEDNVRIIRCMSDFLGFPAPKSMFDSTYFGRLVY